MLPWLSKKAAVITREAARIPIFLIRGLVEIFIVVPLRATAFPFPPTPDNCAAAHIFVGLIKRSYRYTPPRGPTGFFFDMA